MHLNWNDVFSKTLGSSVAVLMAATSLHAIPKDPCECPPPPVCCVEPAPGPFAFAYPYDVDLQCPRDFYVHADALFMQAKEDGMDFVIVDSSAIGTGGSSPITQGQVGGFSGEHSDWGYNPGMRLGIGFYMDHDAWNLDFEWAWLNITEYKHQNSNTAGGVVIPLWLTGIGTPATQVGSNSSAVWNASYNTFDLTLGKPHHVSRYFVMNPHFAVRAAWIDQHFSVDYSGIVTPTAANRTIHHGDNDFWGVGARAGVNTDWILGKGWCLFGNFNAAMLYGKFEIDQNMSYPGATADGFDIHNDFYQNVPNIDIALGIGWDAFFDKKRYRVAMKLAYEFHEWFDQLNLRKFYSGSEGLPTASPAANGAYASDVISRGNLTLNGFSFKLQFDM